MLKCHTPKVVADHLITESGVRPLLHCFAVEAIVQDNLVKVRTLVKKGFCSNGPLF